MDRARTIRLPQAAGVADSFIAASELLLSGYEGDPPMAKLHEGSDGLNGR